MKISDDLRDSFSVFLLTLLISLATYFGTGDLHHHITRQYKIVDVVDGTGTGKYPRLEWIWSIQYLDDNSMEDKRVSFTEFRTHKIGDVLSTTQTQYAEWYLVKTVGIVVTLLIACAAFIELCINIFVSIERW